MEKADFFKSLGFNEYESRALTSFVNLKSASPKQISQDSGVPQNKLYNILKDFEKKGILSVIPSETKRYELINLKTFIENTLSEKQKRLNELKKISNKIEILKESPKDFIFGLIKGQRAIMNKLAEKNLNVKKEILGVQRNWKIWGEGLRNMQRIIKKGVKVKMIGVINNETKKRAKEWRKIGCEIRAYNLKFGENPLRFSIFDNKEARITIGKPEIQNPEDYITIWTNSKPLIFILRKQFFEMWKQSEKFK